MQLLFGLISYQGYLDAIAQIPITEGEGDKISHCTRGSLPVVVQFPVPRNKSEFFCERSFSNREFQAIDFEFENHTEQNYPQRIWQATPIDIGQTLALGKKIEEN